MGKNELDEQAREVTLGEIADVITKGTTPTTLGYDFQDEGVNFLKIECFDEAGNYLGNCAHISEECNEKLSRSKLQKNDILFSIAGAIGRVAIVTEDLLPANTNQALAIIRISDDKVYIPYVKLILQSGIVRRQFEKQEQGVAQLNLSLKNIGDLLIPIFSKERQKEFVGLFSKVQSLIDDRKSQLAELDILIKARFIEMFGDCRANPMGWKTNQLGDIAEVGSSKRVFVEELKDTGIPFYRGTEVGVLAEGKQITPELYITEKHYKELCNASGTPKRGDLLMPSICPDGRIWVVDTDEPFYFKDGRVLWVHEICNSYNPTFLLYTLKDRIMTDYSSIASGTTFAELKIFALKACNVFDVPLALQEQFATFVQATDKLKIEVQKSFDELQLLLDSLMQRYFG